jgi:transcriptional regulator with XRE-family HTH domain
VSLSGDPDFPQRAKALGEAFQRLRQHKNLTVAEVAERARVDEQAVAGAEAGDFDLLSLEIVFRLTVEGMDARLGELGHLTDQYLGRT